MLLKKQTRFEHLDGMRGLASAVVVLHHMLLAFFPSFYFGDKKSSHLSFDALLGRSPVNVLWGGTLAVALFFVHSGFVLSNSFISSGDRRRLADQALRRILRLGIPIAAILFLIAPIVMGHHMLNLSAQHLTKSERWLGTEYTFDPTFKSLVKQAFGEALFTPKHFWDSSLWTMRIEVAGSFLVLALAALFRDDKRRMIAYSFTLAYFAFVGEIWMAAFVAGLILRTNNTTKLEKPRDYFLLSALGIYFGSYPIHPGLWHRPLVLAAQFIHVRQPLETFKIISAVLLFKVILDSKAAERILQRKVPKFLGRISFMLYLIHVPILLSSGCWLYLRLRTPGSDLGHTNAALLAMLLTVVLSLAAAYFVTIFVDEPAIRFARKVSERDSSEDGHAASAPIKATDEFRPEPSSDFGQSRQPDQTTAVTLISAGVH